MRGKQLSSCKSQQDRTQVLPGFRELLSKPLGEMWPRSCAAEAQPRIFVATSDSAGHREIQECAYQLPFTELSTLCSLDLCRFEVIASTGFGLENTKLVNQLYPAF